MKNLIITAAVAIAAMFAIVTPAQAGECCPKSSFGFFGCGKKVSTVEVCRRCFTKTICVCGCPKQIEYVEVTYCTTYCNGMTKNWTKIYRV
ncbi:MAG: hypothetical protein P1U89_16365 [Verrucomicrobiales bacterium]|nr:hypothetical protein [Verrucomicrobiales bacterium]